MAVTRTAGVVFGVPAVVLTTAGAKGSERQAIAIDASVVAFDVTVPTVVAASDTGAVGSAVVAARRDHQHESGAFGDVSGPGSAVDNEITRFNGTGGKTLQAYTSTGPTVGDTGIMRQVGQPAVIARNPTTVVNQTGTGTNATVPFSTEILDVVGEWATPTFTAEGDGVRNVQGAIRVEGRTTASTTCSIRIIASNETYFCALLRPVGSTDDISIPFAANVFMDDNDTFTITVAWSGEASDVVDIGGYSGPRTFFSCVKIT